MAAEPCRLSQAASTTTKPTQPTNGRWYNILKTSLVMVLLSAIIFYYRKLETHHCCVSTNVKDETKSSKLTATLTQPLQQEPEPHQQASRPDETFVDIMNYHSNVHQFNRHMLLPLIKSIITMDYFRYFKINLNRPCKLWCNADKCNLRDCRVKTLIDPNKCPISTYDDNNELAVVNTELASDQLGLLTELFECNDNDDHDSQYVDLLLNPERFTGYSGESAHRIWRAIYEENCFVTRLRQPFGQAMCYEERLFYEAISGLHTSINIHLSAEYPSNAMMGTFEPNLNEFLRRFEDHNDYIENLYKLYLIELRALTRSKPYLMKRVNWPDSSTKNAVHDLLTVVDKFQLPMFQEFSLKPSHVSHELAIHFRNITTTIIDCVACDKCKLWGRVQLRGLGTALKILSVKDLTSANFHLNHQEIASLVNALARLSHSIKNLEQFRDLLKNSKQASGKTTTTKTVNTSTRSSNQVHHSQPPPPPPNVPPH